jgi:hypothetical protein
MKTVNKQHDDGIFKSEALILTRHSLETMPNREGEVNILKNSIKKINFFALMIWMFLGVAVCSCNNEPVNDNPDVDNNGVRLVSSFNYYYYYDDYVYEETYFFEYDNQNRLSKITWEYDQVESYYVITYPDAYHIKCHLKINYYYGGSDSNTILFTLDDQGNIINDDGDDSYRRSFSYSNGYLTSQNYNHNYGSGSHKHLFDWNAGNLIRIGDNKGYNIEYGTLPYKPCSISPFWLMLVPDFLDSDFGFNVCFPTHFGKEVKNLPIKYDEYVDDVDDDEVQEHSGTVEYQLDEEGYVIKAKINFSHVYYNSSYDDYDDEIIINIYYK